MVKKLEQPKQFWEVKIKLQDNWILTLIIKLKQSRHFSIDINNEIGPPRWLSTKESTGQAGDVGAIPGPGRLPGEGNSIPLQYSCMGNSMERGAWWATIHGVTESQIQLSD